MVQGAANVIKDGESSSWREHGEQDLQKRDGILLLFPGSIDIGEKDRNIVSAHDSEEACVVEAASVRLLVRLSGCLECPTTLLQDVRRYL